MRRDQGGLEPKLRFFFFYCRMQSPSQPGSSAGQESIIVCRNSQGSSVRGSLMHFSNQTAVFEVYNPFSIL